LADALADSLVSEETAALVLSEEPAPSSPRKVHHRGRR
jgi:hypothetical protein